MLYEYYCEKCVKTTTVSKPMSESSRDEYCDECKKKIRRIFAAPSISTNDGFKS